MIRGTTPTLEFNLPFDVSDIAAGYITFSQYGQPVFEKELKDAVCVGTLITLKLSQEDKLKLLAGTRTYIQLRVRLVTGDAMASKIMTVRTDMILKDGVI